MNPAFQETMEEKQRPLKEAVCTALADMPIVQLALKRASVTRPTYYRWRKEDAEFAERADVAIHEGIEVMNDMSESQLLSLIKDKDGASIRYWLEHHHPSYMRSQRKVVVESEGGSFKIEVPYEQFQ